MAPRRTRDARSSRERDRIYLEENRRRLEEHQQRLDEHLRQLKERDRRAQERQRLAEERDHPIIERAKAGATYLAISQELGVPVGLVRRVCRQAGVKAPRPQDEATMQRHQQIVEQVRAGSSLAAAARAFGLSPRSGLAYLRASRSALAVAAGPAPLPRLEGERSVRHPRRSSVALHSPRQSLSPKIQGQVASSRDTAVTSPSLLRKLKMIERPPLRPVMV